jgi:iron-sulfur cluster repair protein YtfE (RIC family)
MREPAVQTMTPTEARTKLLEQHEGLRTLLAAAEISARRVLQGETVLAEFRRGLDALRSALAEHNRTEEALLEPMLSGADDWGPKRVARMTEEHLAEHAAVRAALAGPEVEVAQRMADLVEDLLAHMAAEERTFLSPGVLRDAPRTRGG